MSPTSPSPTPHDSQRENYTLIPASPREKAARDGKLATVEAPEAGAASKKATGQAFMSPRERPVCEG